MARRHGPHAFWIDWRSDPDVLATSLGEVARPLGLSAEKIAQAQRAGASLPDLVWTHLESVRGWLVVVDNVDDVDSLQGGANRISTYRGWLRPTAAGRLLVTTRLLDTELWGPQARLHRIGRLPTAVAAAVLRDYAPHGGDAAEELAERLGGSPPDRRRTPSATGTAVPTAATPPQAVRRRRTRATPGTGGSRRYPSTVPRYDFRCLACSTTFEVDRPMAAAGDPARCPHGHTDTVKLLSTVALGGRASGGRAPMPAAPAGGGGCCGGGCCG